MRVWVGKCLIEPFFFATLIDHVIQYNSINEFIIRSAGEQLVIIEN